MSRNALLTTAIFAFLPISAAFADVTPEEVWENWQAMSTSTGQELTVGGSARNGDTLDVTDILIITKDPMGGSASVSFDTLSFKDNGDGTVTVLMPESYPMNMAFPPEADGTGPGSMKLTISQPGMTIIASGSVTDTNYDFTAPTGSIKLDEVTDASGKVLDTKAEVTMTEASGKYVVHREGDKTALDTAFSVKSLALNIEGEDPETSGKGTGTLSLADVTMTMKGNVLGPDVMENMAVALNSGFTMDMALGFGAMSFSVDAVDATGPTKVSLDATDGSMNLALNKESLTYGVGLAGMKLVVSGPEIPFPQVEVGLGEFAFNVMMPVSKSDEPQAFSYLTKFVDLTTSEDIWGLFDPVGSLSRDPVTFVVDVKGMGRWYQDITDPSFDIESVDLPGELDSLDLTLLQAKAAGADVTANGGLTFDNSDTVTYGGAPKPTGKVTVNIKGVQALIDNLIAMGILTDDDAMGFRMVLAMYARPGAGADELVSELEFKDGGFFANGQQVW